MANIRQNLDQAVLNAIQDEMKRQTDEIIRDAENRVRKAIHRVVANAAITTHDYYDIERQGENLVITIKCMTE